MSELVPLEQRATIIHVFESAIHPDAHQQRPPVVVVRKTSVRRVLWSLPQPAFPDAILLREEATMSCAVQPSSMVQLDFAA